MPTTASSARLRRGLRLRQPRPDGIEVRGQGNGVNTVNGGLDGGGGFARGGPVRDFQDVYLIYIRDASGFAARTIGPIGDATFDTRLFLFRPDGRVSSPRTMPTRATRRRP